MESEGLELNVSYDLVTKRYFVTQETLNKIIENYEKLYNVRMAMNKLLKASGLPSIDEIRANKEVEGE